MINCFLNTSVNLDMLRWERSPYPKQNYKILLLGLCVFYSIQNQHIDMHRWQVIPELKIDS